MRRIEFLITDVRASTNNQEWSQSEGVPQSEFIRWLRDAQRRLHNLISQQHPTVFVKEAILDVVQGQESYPVPSDAFLGQKIIAMEYSSTGNINAFRPVELGRFKERHRVPGYPRIYIPRDGSFLLNPIPQSNVAQGLSVTYQYVLPTLDIRRGSIASSVLTSSPNHVTSITLNNDSTLDPTIFAAGVDYVCIVDKDGNFLMKDIAISSWNPTTLTLTGDATFLYQTGETIPAGSYIVVGKNTSTHSPLTDLCEDYLMDYCGYQILRRDSNIDSAEALSNLQAKEKEIVDSYANLSEDFEGIPIVSHEFGFY